MTTLAILIALVVIAAIVLEVRAAQRHTALRDELKSDAVKLEQRLKDGTAKAVQYVSEGINSVTKV